MVIVRLIVGRLATNSRNSSKPPSLDPNRKREKKTGGERKRGGQEGRIGNNLKPIENPDEIIPLSIDRRTLPRGKYKNAGYESRQVIEIQISTHILEYRAEVLEDDKGIRYVAEFPDKVTRPVQYGSTVKSQAVYLSQFQLIPYNRIEDYFRDQVGLQLSSGSIYNFISEGYELLEKFEQIVKLKLIESGILHVDETGINIDGKRIWLHLVSSDKWTYFFPHAKRGSEAMDEIGILPKFNGILCHDHWKAYYIYACLHALCNAHHLRELENAWETEGQKWAKKMKGLLEEINIAVEEDGGELVPEKAEEYRIRYKNIIQEAEIESPRVIPESATGKRGRIKQTKARNLLERLRDYEEDTLRFMVNKIVPFTNNLAENDLRMTKVQQKISGCFRSIEGAKFFCRIRGYLSTCRKHNISASQALNMLFQGKLPDFVC